MTISPRSFDVVIGALERFLTVQVPRAQRAAVVAGGVPLRTHIRSNIGIPAIGGSAKSHASALAGADHPYATKHPDIQIEPAGGSPGFRRRKLLVHTVSGRLLSALTAKLDAGSGRAGDAAFVVGLDVAKAPYAKYIVQGTQIMHQRDILWETATDPRVKKDIRAGLVLEFKRVLRF